MYRRVFENSARPNRVIDYRSDTLSVPTKEMREAMFTAEVGDDVYEEDPTVKELQNRCATIFGKEAALFVPSGTMANLLSIMIHCEKRGSEVMMGDWSHTHCYEQGTAAGLAGVSMNKLKNLDDGTFCLEELKNNIRGSDIHEPISSLVVIENTHNMAGGKVLPLSFIEDVSIICKENNMKLHMDGARVFNAAEYLQVPMSRVVRDVDSVCFCLSKGLACPVGSILMGSSEFIVKARRYRKALGGGMRQVGFLAAAGLVALDQIVPKLGADHKRTKDIAVAINNLKSSVFSVDLANLHTNILMINVKSDKITALELSNRFAAITDKEIEAGIVDDEGLGILVKSSCKNITTLRLVMYTQITDKDNEFAIKKILYSMKDLERMSA